MSTTCSSYNHSGKPPAAKVHQLLVSDPQKAAVELRPPRVAARDGMMVGIGAAYCAIHSKDLVRQGRTVSAAFVADLGGPTGDLALDYAKGLYEKRLDEEAARQAEQAQRWAQHRQDAYANSVFTVRDHDRDRHRGVKAWLIEGRAPDRNGGEPYPMTIVEVHEDGGVLWVTTSDYMNSGPGRGNPSWTKALIETLQKAAEVQDDGGL